MANELKERPATPSTIDLPTQWLVNLGLDVSKLTLGVYLLGTIASLIYYSRFSILTLDLIRTQSILVGCYVVTAYCILPAATLRACKEVPNASRAIITVLVVIYAADFVIIRFAGYRGWTLSALSSVMVALQLSFFIVLDSVKQSKRERRMLVRFTVIPKKARSAVLLVPCLFHFSNVLLPHIPMYLGGAQPMNVEVFTEKANLASVRMSGVKPSRNFNGTLDSFQMNLLYESDKDAYFLTELTSNGAIFAHLVTRIHKDEIQRMDYQTPEWVNWK